MALILNTKYSDKKEIFHFYRNRLLRIFPLYIFVLFLTIAFSFFWTSLNLPNPMNQLYKDFSNLHISTILYLIFENIFIVTSDLGNFLTVDKGGMLQYSPLGASFVYNHSLIPQAWTLGIELIFYLIAPFIVKRNSGILILLISISITIRLFIYSMGFHFEPWTNRFMPTEFVFFLLGIISYRFYNYNKHQTISIKIFTILYSTFIVFTIFYEKLPKILYLPLNPIQWIYFLTLVIFIPYIFKIFKNNSIDKFLGDLSYPIYISHILVIFIIRNAKTGIDINQASAFSILLTILISIMLLGTIGKFFENFRK